MGTVSKSKKWNVVKIVEAAVDAVGAAAAVAAVVGAAADWWNVA